MKIISKKKYSKQKLSSLKQMMANTSMPRNQRFKKYLEEKIHCTATFLLAVFSKGSKKKFGRHTVGKFQMKLQLFRLI